MMMTIQNKVLPVSFLILSLVFATVADARLTLDDGRTRGGGIIETKKNTLKRFHLHEKLTGLLSRRLNGNKVLDSFGPGVDWSCTAKGAIDNESCAENGGDSEVCFWCPLGTTTGVCVGIDQAEVINSLENDNLLHLKCFNSKDDKEPKEGNKDEEHTKFWDEAIECHSHGAGDCVGEHGNGHHLCTWCTVENPAINFCLSRPLWDNLVVAQALEEFDRDVSTNDQIRLDQVIHCVDHDDDDSSNSTDAANSTVSASVWDTMCAFAEVLKTDKDKEDCHSKKDADGESCVVQVNPFPGLMGSAAGNHCVSLQQQRIILWVVGILRDMGWQKEMSSFQ